jgi:hypothetical protein
LLLSVNAVELELLPLLLIELSLDFVLESTNEVNVFVLLLLESKKLVVLLRSIELPSPDSETAESDATARLSVLVVVFVTLFVVGVLESLLLSPPKFAGVTGRPRRI